MPQAETRKSTSSSPGLGTSNSASFSGRLSTIPGLSRSHAFILHQFYYSKGFPRRHNKCFCKIGFLDLLGVSRKQGDGASNFCHLCRTKWWESVCSFALG